MQTFLIRPSSRSTSVAIMRAEARALQATARVRRCAAFDRAHSISPVPEPNQRVQEFSAAIAWERYRGAHYAFVALRQGTILHNLGCRLVLDAREPSAQDAFTSEIERLVIRKGWVPRDEVRALIGRLAESQTTIAIDGHDLTLTNGSERPYGFNNWLPSERARKRVGWVSQELVGSGETISRFIGEERYQTLARRLPGAEPQPFASWAHLGAFLGSEFHLTHDYSAFFDCFAPTYARIADATMVLVTGECEIAVELREPITAADVRLVLAPDDPEFRAVVVPGPDWTRAEDDIWRASVAFKPDVGSVRVQLLAQGELLEERTIGVPSLASRVHGVVDPELAWLRRLLGLGGAPAKSDGFEHGVLAVLNLGGLSAVHYGHASGENFPDLIACVGSSYLVVGECTTDAPSLHKIQTVHARAEAVRARATEQKWDVRLARTLFTPQPERSLSTEARERAEELSVGICAQEQLEQLLEAVIRGDQPRHVWWLLATFCGKFASIKM